VPTVRAHVDQSWTARSEPQAEQSPRQGSASTDIRPYVLQARAQERWFRSALHDHPADLSVPDGRGLKQIAHALNNEAVPAPSAGRRGSGSWAPSAVRTILLTPRYRGTYIHGRIKMVRQSNGVIRVKADPTEMITVDIPEWQIVDDAIWFAVNERFTSRTPTIPQRPACGEVSAHWYREVRQLRVRVYCAESATAARSITSDETRSAP
jgi:hypothetical protein